MAANKASKSSSVVEHLLGAELADKSKRFHSITLLLHFNYLTLLMIISLLGAIIIYRIYIIYDQFKRRQTSK